MIKIAIDSGPLTSGDSIRGIGVYVRELINSLKDTKAVKDLGVSVGLLTGNKSLEKEHFDIVHFTRFNPFFVSIPFNKPKDTKFVLTIYDFIPLIYPKNYPPGVKGNIRFLINKYLINKNVDAIITISETSKKDICRFLRVDPSKVFVTYLAPRAIFKKMEIGDRKQETIKKYGLPNSFALYVGDTNYNKNIPNLLDACKIAKIPLVIAGKQATDIEKMDLNHPELSHLKDLDWSNTLRLGFVPDSDLVKIYNLATVYIQPSLYEGFGLPLVEAIACGTPVVSAKTQCLVEILGPDFTYIDQNSPESLATGIGNPNTNKKLPRDYSWKNTAEETLNVYTKIS